MVRKAAWVALFAVVFGLGHSSAQSFIPNGAFLRDSAGNTWLVNGGAKSRVPIYPAADDQIAAIPDNGAWVVPAPDGGLTLGTRPDWEGLPPTGLFPGQAAAPTSTPVPDDKLPTVVLQVSDDRIDPGEEIEITVIASDDKGVDRIEWEGTIVDDDDENDNKQTGDPALDERHRHDCDDQRECAQVWKVKPTKSGRYTIRARARDTADQFSEWVTQELRVREGQGQATPTVTPTKTP